jgi:hypothetical protein
MKGQILPGVLRTFVPLAVGYLLNLAVVQTLGLTESQLTTALTVVMAGAYWLAVRMFEVYASPKFSRLLGAKATPIYTTDLER